MRRDVTSLDSSSTSIVPLVVVYVVGYMCEHVMIITEGK